MGEAKLCLPTVRSTLLSALLVSGMIFIGLVALSASEVGIFGQKMGWLTLLLRLVGWLFLFYIPIHFISMPFTRNFVLWSLQPGEKLTRARSYVETPNLSARRANCLPYVIHTAWISAYTLLVCVHIGEKEHFGFIPIYGLGNLLMMPIGIVTTLLLAPPTVSRRYAFSIGPATLLLPILGFLIVVTSYSLLRRSLGPQLGLVIPLILSFYELLGTSLVSRIFTKQFVIQPEVREGYTGTNQGIVVSMAICNLHAMAEGARLTLLYVDHVQNQDLTILMPIISGVLWNVMARLGGLDRLLHIITRGWRRPNNSSKLLRESGYCVGYLRFGAVGAMLLARLCNGVPVPLNGPEMIIVLSVLLAEAVEDLLSYALWYIGVDFSPPSLLVTEQEVEAMATTRLSKRKGSKEPTRRSSSKESSSSVVPTLPTPTPTPASLPHSARGRTAPLPDPHGGPPPRPLSPSSPKSPKPDRTLMKSTCWSTRVAYDFRFRIEEFEKMPFWGHLLPAAMAQFHTIFAMIIFSQGLDHMLGFCTEADSGFTYDSAIFWWPIQYPKC